MLGIARRVAAVALCLLVISGVSFAEQKLTLYNLDPETLWIQEFAKKHDVKVERVSSTGAEADNKLAILIASGQTPDLIGEWCLRNWAHFAAMGVFEDLSPYIARSDLRNDRDLLPPALNAFRVGERVDAILGVYRTGVVAQYNAELLHQAGLALPSTDWRDMSWNWDMLRTYGKKLTKIGSDGNVEVGGAFLDQEGGVYGLLWDAGGEIFPPEAYSRGFTTATTFANPRNAEALDRMAMAYREGWLNTGGDYYQARSAIYLCPWRPEWLARIAGPKRSWDGPEGLAPFPSVSTSRTASAGPMPGVAMSATSKNKELAWKYMETALRPGNEGAYTGVVRVSDLRKIADAAYANGYSVLNPAQILDFIATSANYSRAFPPYVVAGANEVNTQFVAAIQDIRLGRAAALPRLEELERVTTAYLAGYVKQHDFR